MGLVESAVAEDIAIHVLPGASASLTGLLVSGLPARRFVFEGFLPTQQSKREEALAALAKLPSTLVFFERGNRVGETLADIKAVLGERPAVIARELTKHYEEVLRGSIGELVELAASRELKGECVLLVGGALEQAEATPEEVDKLLIALMAEKSLKDAVDEVSLTLKAHKRDVYQRALALKNQK